MENNTVYQRIKEKHPDWSDEQIWTAASLQMQADVVLDSHEEVSFEDPDIMELIIRGAMEWLDEALPLIFEKVKQMFANLLQNLGAWIRKGWEYVMQIISKGFIYE